MKHRRMDDGTLWIKAEAGDEIVGALTGLVNELGVYAGAFSAIGACSEAEIGHWDPRERVYNKKVFTGAIEIVSLLGNVCKTESGAFLHPHVSLGFSDYSMKGGHLFRAVAAPTCEIVLRPHAGAVDRRLDESCGLKLWSL